MPEALPRSKTHASIRNFDPEFLPFPRGRTGDVPRSCSRVALTRRHTGCVPSNRLLADPTGWRSR